MAIKINNQNYDDGLSCPYGLIVRCRACHRVDFEQTLFRETWERILVYSCAAVLISTVLYVAGFWEVVTKFIF